VNKTDGNGQTALYWAAKGGHPAVMQLLLENGADIEAKNSKGWTPLHSAAGRGNEAVVYLLLEKGQMRKQRIRVKGWRYTRRLGVGIRR
jgi:ankyrin repeat protein